jgi:hypothetical protein
MELGRNMIIVSTFDHYLNAKLSYMRYGPKTVNLSVRVWEKSRPDISHISYIGPSVMSAKNINRFMHRLTMVLRCIRASNDNGRLTGTAL